MIAKAKATKSALAKEQGMARSSLYYQPKMPLKDWHLKNQIELALKDHNGYGHKKLATHLKINKKRILRVMKLFSIKPYRRRGKKIYLATVMDLFGRKIVDWSLLNTHSVQLPLNALIDAVEKYGRPKILHSDQGSE